VTYTLVTHVLLCGYKLLILNNIKTTLQLSGNERVPRKPLFLKGLALYKLVTNASVDFIPV